MKNNKVSIDLDIEDLLGLKEPKKGTLEYDLNFIIDNGMEEYLRLQEEEKQKDKEFVEMFKRNYDEIVKLRGMDIVFVTTAEADEEAKELLKLLGMPFKA